MSICKWLIPATLVGAVMAGSACAREAADDTAGRDTVLPVTSESAPAIVDETKNAGEKTVDATRSVAEKTADKTKEIAVAVGTTAKDVVSTTGEAITDGWITAKVSAKLADETLLEKSDINVDTNDHVVTLKGAVGSDAARARAAEIARGTEGVARVVNALVVK